MPLGLLRQSKNYPIDEDNIIYIYVCVLLGVGGTWTNNYFRRRKSW